MRTPKIRYPKCGMMCTEQTETSHDELAHSNETARYHITLGRSTYEGATKTSETAAEEESQFVSFVFRFCA